jgi:tRNA dimethylallyltransferase
MVMANPSPADWPLVVVLGPTGAGKSELALVLAEAANGEIVNCDSIQVYRGLEIGAAKIPASERRGIPHHLIDIIDANQELTAGAYARAARKTLAAVRSRARVPIIAGGTGFYLRALLNGLAPVPPRNEALRNRLNTLAAQRTAALHRFLRIYDPATAARIHSNDRQKLIRAVELMLLAAQPVTKTHAAGRDSLEGFAVLKIGLAPPKPLLSERLNQRAAAMFRNGLLEETKALLTSGISPQAKPLQSLGYKQAVEVLFADRTRKDALRECQTKTRQYAKRQMTWFRAEADVLWLDGFGSDPMIQAQALEAMREFLAGYSLAS